MFPFTSSLYLQSLIHAILHAGRGCFPSTQIAGRIKRCGNVAVFIIPRNLYTGLLGGENLLVMERAG